jgi:hypothetical protein
MKKLTFPIFSILFFCAGIYAQEPSITSKSSNGITNEKGIKSMLPPQLSYPANESVIDINYPVLIWIPPRPISGMLVTYALRLVEIQKGQTLAEALLQNPPLINLGGLSNTFLNYPADAPPLHVDGHYAWQVAASYGGQSLGATDIWSFTIKNSKQEKNDDINYPVAAKVSKEQFYLSHGIFHFAYDNRANEKTLSYTIKAIGKSTGNIKGLPTIELTPGMNKLQVDLKKSGKLKNGSYYYLEIKDNKRQVYKLIYYYEET